MIFTVILLLILVFFLGLGAWFAFVWAVKDGQFEDPEAPKYRMLMDDDDFSTDEDD